MTYKLGEGENATQIAKYKYFYDANGNVTRVESDGEIIAKYQYDSLNQLKAAWDYQQLLKFYYNYDNSGNIESSTYQSLTAGYEDYVTGNPHSANYYYRDSDWGDLLTEYKGTTLSYDAIGNPTNYRDGMTMSWTGRELQSITKNSNTYSFTYNLDGLRTKKQINNDSIVNYYYDDSNNLIGLKKGNTTVLFYYDSEGSLYSMSKGDDTYFFIKDLQGDIRKIIDEEGTVVATYAYDAWGALLAENEDSSIEGFNPFRYRGYVYDPETELYYLQSRYYDPKTGRFINADDSDYTDTYSGSPLSTNMFAYCENNAVNGEDPSGNWTLDLHKKLSKSAKKKYKIKSKIPNSLFLADLIFKSNDYYSSPFHSRNNLNVVEELFNAAIDLKYSLKKSNKKIRIVPGSSEKGTHFSRDRKKYYIPKNMVYYKNQSTNKYKETGDNQKSLSILKYLNGELKINNKEEKVLYSGNKKYKYIIKDRKSQADALFGFAMHSLQDYFAHKIVLYYSKSKSKVSSKNVLNLLKRANNPDCKFNIDNHDNYMTITKYNDSIFKNYNIKKEDFEDSETVFQWRFQAAQNNTNFFYDLYYHNKEKEKISNISVIFGNDKIYNFSKKFKGKLKNLHYRLIKMDLSVDTYWEDDIE